MKTSFLLVIAVAFSINLAKAQSVKLKRSIDEKEIKFLKENLLSCFAYDRNFKVSYSTSELFNRPGNGDHLASPEYIEELKKKLKHDRAEADYCLEISGFYARLNMEKEAAEYRQRSIDITRKVLEQHPDSAIAWYVLANATAGTMNFEENMGYYKKALSIDPHLSVAAGSLMNNYLMSQQIDSGMQVAKRYLATHPNDTGFYAGVPMYYVMRLFTFVPKFQTKADIDAFSLDSLTYMPLMDDYRERFKINPNTEYVYRVTKQILLCSFIPLRAMADSSFDMDIARMNLKEPDVKALTEYRPYFEQLLKEKDARKYFYANKLLGNMYVLLDEREKAIPYMKKVIELRPKKYMTYDVNTDEDYMNLMSTYCLLKDTLNFEKTLLQKIKEQPTVDPQAKDYNDLAFLYLSKNKFDLAKTYYEKALQVSDAYLQRTYELNESKCTSLLGLGMVEYLNHNETAALEYVNKVYKIDPKNWKLFMLYGVILLKQNDANNAYEVFKTLKLLHDREWVQEDFLDRYFEKLPR